MMDDSADVRASPKRIKRSRWGPVTENDSPIKPDETEKVISNGTENVSSTSESSPHVDDEKETPKCVKVSKVSKIVKAEQLKERSKSPQLEKPSEEKITSSCESPSSSHLIDGFCGFDDAALSEYDTRLTKLRKLISFEKESSGFYITVEENNVDDKDNNSETEDDSRREEDMTVDTGHVSSESDTTDRDSNQMEIDIDKDSSPKPDPTELSAKDDDKGDDRTKETDVDVEIIEVDKDPVEVSEVKPSRRNKRDMASKTATTDEKNSSILENTLKGGNGTIEYCGVCESQVDDAEEGICCDGNCEQWFHLRCSGLTQIEYDELGLDENAKWACNKCSGKPPPLPVLKADAKPLLSVRKDLAKTPVTPTVKRRSIVREGTPRTPKIDISNPAYLKPFDYGWKRELVYRSTNENHNNRRQGDIYYYTPKGKKLRSLREISDHLAGSDLTQDNFTFWKEPLGTDDPEKEIIRDAKLKLANRDPSVTPTVIKKMTPKTPKPVKVTPRLTATVTPMDTANIQVEPPVAATTSTSTQPATSSNNKALASITPRVVFKNKTTGATTTGPKFKVTPSKNNVPGQPPRVTITKGNEKRMVNHIPFKPVHRKEPFINPYRSYESVIADPRGSVSYTKNVIEIGKAKNLIEIGKDLEIKKKNNFRRYGLLANAKTPRKSVTQTTTVTLSSSDDDDDDGVNGGIQRTFQNNLSSLGLIVGQKPKLTPKAVHFCMSEDNKRYHNRKEIIHPLSKTVLNNNKTNYNRSPVQNLTKNKQRSPEIQFRPCNPSSYGCQTSPLKPHTSVRPASISGMSSSLYCSSVYEPNFETVLIVDTNSTSGNYISSPKHRESQYESPLFLKDGDFPCKISSVESLRSEDRMSKYDASYIVASSSKQSHTQIKGSLLRITENRRNEPDFRRSDNCSPVSVDSTSPEEILVYEEELEDNNMPPFHMKNSSPPKLTRICTPSSKSPPSLRPIMSPPPLVPCPTRGEARPLLTRQNFVEQSPGTSRASTNIKKEEIMDTNNKVSLQNEYRKMKRERLYKKIKVNKMNEKIVKSYLNHMNESKKIHIKYLKLKMKLKEKKLKKIQKKEMKGSMQDKLKQH